jgi:hypothetical protein
MGGSIFIGYPRAGWLRENPKINWMIWGQTFFSKPSYGFIYGTIRESQKQQHLKHVWDISG